MREETLYELETPYRQKFKIRGFRFGEGEKACAMVAAVLRYLSRVGLLRYHCHSGYLSTVVQENEMANVLTPAGGIFPLTTEHEVAFKVIRRLHGGCL